MSSGPSSSWSSTWRRRSGKTPDTHIFKRVDGVQLSLDVYPSASSKSAVLMCIHGGGLISGSRKDIAGDDGPGLLRRLCADAGFTQVAIDYRLAPETRLPDILEDVRDAWRWLHEEMPSLYDVEVERMAVLGRSAGALLALLCGIHMAPAPGAVISLYGYGDLLAAWCQQPDPYYLRQALVDEGTARRIAESGPATEGTPEAPRFPLYVYHRQRGTWARAITGMDPSVDYDQIAKLCPVRSIGESYPPALLIHGTADTDVPYHASVEMAHALTSRGLEAELLSVPEADHVFDRGVSHDDLAAASPPAAARTFNSVVDFLQRHV